MKILNFPEVRQAYEYDCGAAAVESVLEYYGFDVSESEVMKVAGTKRSGTPINGILKTIKKFGLKSDHGRLTVNKIQKYIDRKIPVILVLQAWTEKKDVNWETDWTDGHYVIVIGYDKHKLYFADPSSILRTYLTYKELEKRWHDKNQQNKKYVHYGIAVYGKKSENLKKKIHMD